MADCADCGPKGCCTRHQNEILSRIYAGELKDYVAEARAGEGRGDPSGSL